MYMIVLSLIIVGKGIGHQNWAHKAGQVSYISHLTRYQPISLQFSSPIPINNLIGVERSLGSKVGKIEAIEFTVDTSKCRVYPSPYEDYIYFNVADIPPSGRPGTPMLPLKSFVIKLPLGSKVTGVEVVEGTYVEIKPKLKIVPNPTPMIIRGDEGGEYIPLPEIYTLHTHFPGKLVEFEVGSDNNFTYCFVRFHPLQYIPAEGKVYIVTSAKILLYYEEGVRVSFPKKGAEKVIILCPQEFQAEAESLKVFHETTLNMATFIATTEWVSVNYTPALLPPFRGWSDTTIPEIVGYDFELARKIINYLRDNEAHPNLEHVVLLGDAEKVPPSYYYYMPYARREVLNFAPSDLLYSSPDYDFVPNYGVGRLSASDTTELLHIIRKIKDWHPASWSWFKNTAIIGGDPFTKHFLYFSEAGLADCINKEYFTGHDIIKCFLTDRKFTASVVAPYLSDGNLGIFFEISHGSGDAIRFDDRTNITADEVLAYPPASNLPIVATPACVVGAFDTDLASNIGFPTSFGEAVLKSKAGGICFFGGARLNFAGIYYHIDKGRLIIPRNRYFVEIFENVAKSYHAGRDTLGNIYKSVLFDFVSNNDMTYPFNQWSCFCFVLLGDPVLPIPQQEPGPVYQTPQLSAILPTYYNTGDYPVYNLLPGILEVTVNSVTNSGSVKYKLCNARIAEPVIDTATDNTLPFDYTFPTDSGGGFYLVRTETQDKKEGWLYLYSTPGRIAVDGDKVDWETAGISPCATDSIESRLQYYDLTTLYVTDDQYNWYFGFGGVDFPQGITVNYILAIDCKPGGYTGTQGVDLDVLGHWVTFGTNHPVDYEIVLKTTWYNIASKFATWEDGTWWLTDLLNLGGYAVFNTVDSFVEFMIPKSLIGDPSEMHLSLYSGGQNIETREYSPALDAVPTDPATYDSLVWGKEYANTITNFVTIYEVGAEETASRTLPLPSLTVFPNPASRGAVINYSMNSETNYTLQVYDIAGRLVKKLSAGVGKPGKFSVKCETKELRSGVYFVRFDTGKHTLTKKLIVTK